jgi:hypothetical protein
MKRSRVGDQDLFVWRRFAKTVFRRRAVEWRIGKQPYCQGELNVRYRLDG